MQNNKQFLTARQDFYQLRKGRSLPPKMQIKLKYLQSSILMKQFNQQQYDQLPEFERQSLEQMNRETQKNLFINIISCLSGKQVLVYFTSEPAYIRKEEMFSTWTSCFISCNSNTVLFQKKSKDQKQWKQFLIQKLWISKTYKEFKSKVVFGIVYDKKKYYIGFDQDKTCKRIHNIIAQLVKERKKRKNEQSQVKSAVKQEENVSQISKLEYEREQKASKWQQKIENKIQKEEYQFVLLLQSKIIKSQINIESDYKLSKSIEHGRIMQSTKDNKIKITLLIEKCQIQNLVEAYIRFDEWNSQFQQYKIVNRIQNNSYIAYMKVSKYSIFSMARDACVVISYFKNCQCLNKDKVADQNQIKLRQVESQKHYLIIESYQSEEIPIPSGTTRMNFKQIVQFSHPKANEDLLVTILTDIDFKGYSSVSDNIAMSLQLFNEITAFPKFYKEQQLSQNKKSKMFKARYCACMAKKSRKNSLGSSISVSSFRQYDEDNKSIQSKISKQNIPVGPSSSSKKQRMDEQLIIATIMDILDGIRNQNILKIIKQKSYESYYLKARFNQRQQSQKYRLSNFTLTHKKDHLIQNGMWRIENDEYIFCDEEILKLQNGIIKMILKQISSNLFSGKSIMNMSLPVEIFDNKSMLQAIGNNMGFVPKFMHEAVATKNLVQQMKYIFLTAITLNVCNPWIEKPFNPILGQTFQCIVGGIPVYLEQTSHHPPVSTVFIKTDNFQLSGGLNFHVEMGLNSASSKISNILKIKVYATNTTYYLKSVDIEVGGTIYGNRTLKIVNKGYIYESTNDIYCQFSIGKDKKKLYESSQKLGNGGIIGGIFKVTNNFGKKFMSQDWNKTFDGLKTDDVIERYSLLTGKWYGNYYFDGVAYKTITEGPFPLRIERPKYLLPSDCLFREDIIYKRWKEIDKSNREKQVLENIQRNDRKLRQKFVKNIAK